MREDRQAERGEREGLRPLMVLVKAGYRGSSGWRGKYGVASGQRH